jgi:hypothetical protein
MNSGREVAVSRG